MSCRRPQPHGHEHEPTFSCRRSTGCFGKCSLTSDRRSVSIGSAGFFNTGKAWSSCATQPHQGSTALARQIRTDAAPTVASEAEECHPTLIRDIPPTTYHDDLCVTVIRSTRTVAGWVRVEHYDREVYLFVCLPEAVLKSCARAKALAALGTLRGVLSTMSGAGAGAGAGGGALSSDDAVSGGGDRAAREAEVYDRQIRLWGVEAQRRMTSSRVLIAGMGGLNCEVCA